MRGLAPGAGSTTSEPLRAASCLCLFLAIAADALLSQGKSVLMGSREKGGRRSASVRGVFFVFRRSAITLSCACDVLQGSSRTTRKSQQGKMRMFVIGVVLVDVAVVIVKGLTPKVSNTFARCAPECIKGCDRSHLPHPCILNVAVDTIRTRPACHQERKPRIPQRTPDKSTSSFGPCFTEEVTVSSKAGVARPPAPSLFCPNKSSKVPSRKRAGGRGLSEW